MTDEEVLCLALHDILESLDIRYAMVGSIASSVYGVPRATLDVDLLAAVDRTTIDEFVDRLERVFYVDRDAARAAVRTRRSFNVIHDETVVKADIYIPSSAISWRELERRQLHAMPTGEKFWIISAEDVVAHKLAWFKAGSRVATRQLRDVVGVLSVRGDALDWSALEALCAELDVAELLVEARTASME